MYWASNVRLYHWYAVFVCVGGSQLKTTGSKMEEVKTTPAAPQTQTSVEDDMDDGPLNILGEKDVAPVGKTFWFTSHMFVNLCNADMSYVLLEMVQE